MNPVIERQQYPALFRKWNCAADFITAFNSDILGYAIIYTNDFLHNEAYITLLATKPEFQNRRIGTALLHEAERIAIDKGIMSIRLEVARMNAKAIRFYGRNGFIIVVDDEMRRNVFMVKAL